MIKTDKITSYLCPPGNGVHTVHTAQELKEFLHNKLYKTTLNEDVQKKWEDSLKTINDTTLPVVFGITLDTGGGIQRGANWGPLFIRSEILKDSSIQYFDVGDTKTIPHIIHDKYLNEQTIEDCQKALYGETNNLPVSGLSIAEDFCDDFFTKTKLPLLMFGGDHSVSYPVVKSWLKAKKAQNKRTAVIHFDAHTDLMDHRLGIDICFATWAKKIMPFLDKNSDLIQLGIRSSGSDRSHWENSTGAQQFWADEINNDGISSVVKKIKEYILNEKIEELYISFDIDALDAMYASSTGTPEDSGLEPHQCVYAIKELSQLAKVTGADLVEVAPFVNSPKKNTMSPEPQTTLQSSAIIAKCFLEALSNAL